MAKGRKKQASDPKDILRAVVEKVNKSYGEGTLLPASEAISLNVDYLPSGVFDFDVKTGGGFPRGRITMLKGEYSAGKSALSYKAAASAQQRCRFCNTPIYTVSPFGEVIDHGCTCGQNTPMQVLWLDAERSFISSYAAQWGIDISKLYVMEVVTAEQAIDVAEQAIRSKACDLIILDSIAALAPMVEVEESSEDQQMGVAARLFSKACRVWTAGQNSTGLLATTKCTMILINQMRMKLGRFVGITSPGGKAFDFYQSLEAKLKRTEYVTHAPSNRNVGAVIEYEITKNKTYPPMIPIGQFSIYFSRVKGVINVGDTNTAEQVLNLALYWGLARQKGAWFYLGESKFHGKDALIDALHGNHQLVADLSSDILKKESTWYHSGEFDFEGNEESEETEE
jgi:recombination protein RecA